MNARIRAIALTITRELFAGYVGDSLSYKGAQRLAHEGYHSQIVLVGSSLQVKFLYVIRATSCNTFIIVIEVSVNLRRRSV